MDEYWGLIIPPPKVNMQRLVKIGDEEQMAKLVEELWHNGGR
jgi:hypothetical protein